MSIKTTRSSHQVLMLLACVVALAGQLLSVPFARAAEAPPAGAELANNGPDWQIAWIDGNTQNPAGLWPSIAVKPNLPGKLYADQPMISYNTASGDLRLAIRGRLPAEGCAGDSGRWHCATINAPYGSFAQSAIAFHEGDSGMFGVAAASRDRTTMILRTFTSSGYETNTPEIAASMHADWGPNHRHPSLVYVGDRPLLAFYAGGADPFDTEDWLGGLDLYRGGFDDPFQDVESHRSETANPLTIGYFPSVDVAFNAGLGYRTSRIAYRGGGGALKFAEQVGGDDNDSCPVWHNRDYRADWRCTVVDPLVAAYAISHHAPKPGVPNDRTLIAYYDGVSGQLRLARYVGGTSSCGVGPIRGAAGWECLAIDSIGANQSPDNINLALAVDNTTGRISLAYVDKDDLAASVIKLARPAPGGSGGNCGPNNSWRCSVVDLTSLGQNLVHADLALDAAGRAHIAYYNMATGRLMLASEKLPTPPSFSKQYSPGSLVYGEISTLTYRIENNTGTALTGISFHDTLNWQQIRQAGGTIKIPVIDNGCGGSYTITHGAEGDQIAFSGIDLARLAGCVITLGVRADRAGTWNDATSTMVSNEAADKAPVSATLTVAKAPQSISFVPLADQVLQPDQPRVYLSATASSGLKVEFVSLEPEVCGIGTKLVAPSITLTGQAGRCRIRAFQSGDDNYLAAPVVSRSFDVTTEPKQAQSISFGALPTRTLGDEPFAVSVSASSGLPVTLSSETPEVCAVGGGQVTMLAAGSCGLEAVQAGSSAYASTTATTSFVVQKRSQSIELGPLPDRLASDGPFTVSAVASSGLPVSLSATGDCLLSGSTLTLSGLPGSCLVTATQAGDSTYAAALPVSRGFAIGDPAKQAQSISFAPLADRTAGEGPLLLEATASSGLAVSFSAAGVCVASGSTLTLSGDAGVCTVTASQAGDTQFNAAAPVSWSFTVRAPAGAPGGFRLFLPLTRR